ncbi:MAG TPA: ethylbenzene dehydrogenase-related protein [Lacipirellulaceae bacterium]|nr:ethylbenzene dehydrogenase-related protein [Lacipirellulaceae bacterium]
MTSFSLNDRLLKRAIAWAIVLVVLGPAGCQRSSKPAESAAKSATASASKADDNAEKPTNTTTSEPIASQPQLATESGAQLYARHCAACHGERGDGKGIAAAFLFPKPRDFRAGRFRLVSTNNNVPTREDLHAVLLRGMPGSSMPPWPHLSQHERDALVDEIMRMRTEGAREFYTNTLKEDEGLTDEELAAEDVQAEIDEYVEEFTTPGESTEVPEAGTPTADSLTRGKDAYARFTCVQCHGETGKGDGAAAMVDDEGMPTRPRDFTLGVFKGNHDPASLYRRVAYGMPGTPMPASTTMTPEQMIALVHYIRSLSTEEQREAAIAKRTKIVAKRVEAVPESAEADAWDQLEPVLLQTTPLWWRNDADAKLAVQALHDGKAIAIRMSWADTSADEHSLRSESFEDAVAVELYRGPAEPFLGMGDAKSPVDVWFWDADRQSGPLAAADSEYPNTVVDVFPFSEAVVATAELNRPGARMADQPDISLPARAVGNLITPTADDESGGTSLHVAGPRTVTFRVTQSQIVRAMGAWSDGRWTVVMTRALSPSSQDDGTSLEPGGKASVAFAVWDGMHGDRNGQKSVTIWQDLHLEP